MRTFGHRRTDRLTDGAGFIGPEGGSNKQARSGPASGKGPKNGKFNKREKHQIMSKIEA